MSRFDGLGETPLLDLRLIQIMVSIEKTGSITAAAAALGYSQPAISQYIRRAEARLGVGLVTRDGRGAKATAAGRALLNVAPPVSQALQHATDQLRMIQSVSGGALRMAATPAAARAVGPRLLRRLHVANPKWQVTLGEMQTDDAVAAIADGHVDFAVVYHDVDAARREQEWENSGLAYRSIGSNAGYILAAADHAGAEQGRVRLVDFADEDWIVPVGESASLLHRMSLSAGLAPKVAVTTHNLSSWFNEIVGARAVAIATHLDLVDTPLPPGLAVCPLPGADSLMMVRVSRVDQSDSGVMSAAMQSVQAMRVTEIQLDRVASA